MNKFCDIKLVIYLAIFFFPALVATVNHGGSVSNVLLIFLGLVLGWSSWALLEQWEKKILVGFALFFFLIGLSFINTDNIYQSIKKMEKIQLFFWFVPMYLLLKRYQLETGKVYLFGMLFAAWVLFTQAYYQTVVLGWLRAEGEYNPIIIGNISTLFVVLIICAMVSLSLRWQHYLFVLVGCGVALSASIMSGSRGSWITLPVVLLWLLWEKRGDLKLRYSFLILIVFIGLVLASYNVSIVKVRVDRTISHFDLYQASPDKMTSMQARLEHWRDSVEIWKENPVLGTGLGDFEKDITKLISDGKSNLQSSLGNAHNTYLNLLAGTGVIGLIAFLYFVMLAPFLVFRSFWKNETDPWIKYYALSGMATIIAFAVFALTITWLARNPPVRTYLMTIMVFMSSIAVRKRSLVVKESLIKSHFDQKKKS